LQLSLKSLAVPLLKGQDFRLSGGDMAGLLKKKLPTSEAVEPKSTMLTAQVLWAAHAWNATPEEAAQQVVTDLFEHLSRGGSVSVHVEGSDGKDYTLAVSAR
jgi:hypothetical protein